MPAGAMMSPSCSSSSSRDRNPGQRRDSAGNTTAALDVVRTDRGQALMERIRAAIDEAKVSERTSVDAYQREFDRAVTLSTWATWGGAGTLAILLSLAASVMSRDFRARETQAWIRTGQMGLAKGPYSNVSSFPVPGIPAGSFQPVTLLKPPANVAVQLEIEANPRARSARLRVIERALDAA